MRLIDADNIENFAHEPTYGTSEIVLDWIHQIFKDPVFIEENEEQLTELCWKALEGCMNVIKTEPTAYAWIPVEERLPEESGSYLVTYERPGGIRKVCTDYYCSGWYIEEFTACKIISWMPLPKPYTPER